MTLPTALLRGPARWVWLIWLAVLVVVLLTGVSLLRYGGLDGGQRWGLRGATIVPALAYTTIATLILARQPGHLVALLVLWVGIGSALQAGLEEYATYRLLVVGDHTPGVMLAAWLSNMVWIPIDGAAAALLPLYFPNGQLASRRWRWVLLPTFLGLLLMGIGFGTYPGPFGSALGRFDNPYGLTLLGDQSAAVTDAIAIAGMVVLFSAISLAALSLLRRARAARGIERQQLKWFVYAVLAAVVVAPATNTNIPALHVLYLIVSTAIPISIGIAVLRYRLYDIDLLVNRALVYGVLTAILAATYFGCVVALQNLLVSLTGERQSALVTVLSTLAIAALFTPVRRRVQAFIDRRFYRRKYDAGRTLAAFSVTIRNDVDLAVLRERLLQVVADTLQPAEAALWLKPPPD